MKRFAACVAVACPVMATIINVAGAQQPGPLVAFVFGFTSFLVADLAVSTWELKDEVSRKK